MKQLGFLKYLAGYTCIIYCTTAPPHQFATIKLNLSVVMDNIKPYSFPDLLSLSTVYA